jgi:hypothetical protein
LTGFIFDKIRKIYHSISSARTFGAATFWHRYRHRLWPPIPGLKALSAKGVDLDATVLFPKVAETLEKQGFQLLHLSKGSN